MTQNSHLLELSKAGVSVWLDDLDRHRIASGNLQELIDTHCVVGVTTNPSIFEKALTSGVAEYVEPLRALATQGATAEETIRALTVEDVTHACDIFLPTYTATHGVNGRVSLEVDPRLANDTTGTVAQARELWETVNRPNLMIKIPATDAGLPAITEVLSHGISVNVTLIFSTERYEQVLEAWLEGLKQAQANGHGLSKIESVASFFISRVDVLVDSQLDAIGTPDAQTLRGKAAIANGQLAWASYLEFLKRPDWNALNAAGANPQRPLWASTGVKDPAYIDTRYVIELVAPNTVNTMPEGTLKAVADHGEVRGDTMSGTEDDARKVWSELGAVGIDKAQVFRTLETEGVEKFISAWNQLLDGVTKTLSESK